MKHEMHLDPLPFDEMSSGLKIIESRVNDEKRQKVKVGDIIEFSKRPEDKDKIEVRVLEIHQYTSIKDLVNSTPLEYWGPRFKSKEQLLQGSWHYSDEEIKKHGLLAIKIKKL
ncbi:MAG: ASCH domain-containing protein [Candidatus Woesearchaeota archaeon]|jgi:ASC-1-like (ASCH) protein